MFVLNQSQIDFLEAAATHTNGAWAYEPEVAWDLETFGLVLVARRDWDGNEAYTITPEGLLALDHNRSNRP